MFYLVKEEAENTIKREKYVKMLYKEPKYLYVYRSFLSKKYLVVNSYILVRCCILILCYNSILISVIEYTGRYHFDFVQKILILF